MLASNNLRELRRLEKLHPIPKKTSEPFLQTWLFFGLLHEMLGPLDGQRHFLKSRWRAKMHRPGSRVNAPRLIDTSNLVTLLEKWIASPIGDDEIKGAENQNFNHLQHCLNLAFDALDSGVVNYIDENIALSLLSTAELLSEALERKFGARTENYRMWTTAWIKFPKFVNTMLHNGWCTADIQRLRRDYYSFQTLYFYRKMAKSSSPEQHEKCTAAYCAIHTINEEEYQIRH